ncbi:hypothetical protein VitviT2T_002007 [Vitis vinifera]|nr:hypothetical protein VitviT2T_002007 [Vitis vinifera]
MKTFSRHSGFSQPKGRQFDDGEWKLREGGNKERVATEKDMEATFLLAFQSLGIVYGRLNTAPLYVFMSIPKEDIISEQRVYELLSFMFWTITIIPLLKYAFIVLRADDNGEGGLFALYSLLCRHAKVGLHPNDRSANEVMKSISALASKTKVESGARRAIEKHKSSHYLMLFLALFGSCMMYLMNLRDYYSHEVDDAFLTFAWQYVAFTKPIPVTTPHIIHFHSII